MCYSLEISLNLNKHFCGETLRRDLVLKANLLNCDDVYWNYEIEGRRTVEKNICIITVEYSVLSDAIKFLRFLKMRNTYYVESIYNQYSQKLIYASKNYIKTMDKYKANEYKKLKKLETNFDDNENELLRAIKKQI